MEVDRQMEEYALGHYRCFIQAPIEATCREDLWAEHFGFGFQKDV